MDSTAPYSPSILTLSPRRMGCAKAMMMPETRLATVVWAAKPSAMPDHAGRREHPHGHAL